MKKLFISGIVLIHLSGCAYYEDHARERVRDATNEVAPTKYFSAHFHGDCPVEVQPIIEQKAREWNSVSRQHVSYSIDWDLSGTTIMDHVNDPIIICRPNLRDEHGHAICGASTGTIIELSTSKTCDLESSAVHEFGHQMGLPDLPNSESVMHVSRTNKRISAADVRSCAAHKFCPKPGHQDEVEVKVHIDPSIPSTNSNYTHR
jgi:hypothetical protein